MLIRLIAFFIVLLVAAPAFAQDAAKETAFDRITRTGVIRCGYGALCTMIDDGRLEQMAHRYSPDYMPPKKNY